MNTTSRESVSKMDERLDKLADQLSTLVEIVSKNDVTPALVKAVEETCVTCGGAHFWVTHRLDTDITLQSRSGQVEVSNRGLKRILERTVGEKKTYLMRVITRKLQLNELNEIRDQAYENFLIYKERTKKLHDSKIKNRIFNAGDRVLLFNSHLKDIIREA
ncbi:hypothetical protein Tco_0657599 [Tanacetum coccineum]